MITEHLVDCFPKNSQPRQQQIDALKKISNCFKTDKKFIVCCLPTGIGKSHIAMACASASNEIDEHRKLLIENYDIYKRSSSTNSFIHSEEFLNSPAYGCYILTVSKNLQDQYKQMFEDSILLKGKNNYECAIDQSSTVDCAPCLFSPNLKKECFKKDRCSYYSTRREGFQRNDTIMNYKAFFSLPDFLKKREVLICDEASNLEDELVSHCSITITYSSLATEDIEFNKLISDDSDDAYAWINDIQLKANEALQSLKGKFELLKAKNSSNFEGLSQKLAQRCGKLTTLTASLCTVIELWHECQYIVESKSAHEVVLVPLNIKPVSRRMFDYADKVILMSATISNHREYTKSIGISEKDYTYFEFESPFNPKKSPIFCSSKYPLSYNTMEKNLPKVLDMVLEICKRHSGEKGIIHTHTHAITQALRKKTKNDSRFLFREIGITNEDILSEHKRLEKVDTVIVSPSLDSGVSLDDDLGRFQIIVKAPFLSLGSKRIKKLFDKNPNYYVMKMLDTIVQMCGRCTRSVNDHSVTYIVDAVAVNSIKKHKDNLPRHFLHRFE